MIKINMLLRIGSAVLILSPGAAMAGDLVYKPLNPGFGGNPDVFGYLIGTAQIQNQFAEQGGGGGGNAPPEINFPPIVIDLGGVGGTPTPPAPAAASNAGRFSIDNSSSTN